MLCETVRTAKLTPVSARLQDIEGKIDTFIIPKETLVLYALGVVLQDPSTWSSPYKFDPERFDDESVMKTFSLLGFSGPQECPELRFGVYGDHCTFECTGEETAPTFCGGTSYRN